MTRYLFKLYGTAIDYMQVPKGARVERSSQGMRVVKGSKVGVWYKGYKVVEAPTANAATEKFLGTKIKVHRRK